MNYTKSLGDFCLKVGAYLEMQLWSLAVIDPKGKFLQLKEFKYLGRFSRYA